MERKKYKPKITTTRRIRNDSFHAYLQLEKQLILSKGTSQRANSNYTFPKTLSTADDLIDKIS